MRRFLQSNLGIALIIALGWKLVLLCIGFVFDSLQGGAVNLVDHTMRWDAGWYTTIVNDTDTTNAASAAFYPLFPFMVGVVNAASFGFLGLPLAGQIVNLVAVWFALAALIALSTLLLSKTKKVLACYARIICTRRFLFTCVLREGTLPCTIPMGILIRIKAELDRRWHFTRVTYCSQTSSTISNRPMRS